jgi:hypothetical protein
MDIPLLPGSRPRRLATISHQLPTLLKPSQDYLVISVGPRYVAQARTA